MASNGGGYYSLCITSFNYDKGVYLDPNSYSLRFIDKPSNTYVYYYGIRVCFSESNPASYWYEDASANASSSLSCYFLGESTDGRNNTYVFGLIYSNFDVVDSNGEVVFREAGGSSGGNGLQNPYGEYNYSSEDTSGGEYVDSDFEDTSDGGWLSKLTNWLKAPFQKLAQLLAKIFNFFVNFIERILAGFFDFFVTVFVPDTDDIIFDDVKETLLNKFPFIDCFRQIQNDFVNAFDNETGCPTFTITLPTFLGGSTVSPIDFRFYNQYRSWIDGFIIASSYFLFIRKMYYKIPSMIRGE